jgi:hypothetical protein
MALGARLQRLSPVLAAMARDLAAARRETATLRRENARLQARLGGSVSEPAAAPAVLCDRCADVVAVRRRSDRVAVAR